MHPPLDLPQPGQPQLPPMWGAENKAVGYDVLAREAGRPVDTRQVHRCSLPGRFGRWYHRLREGAEVRCRGCGLVFVLRRRPIQTKLGGEDLWWELHPGYTLEP